MIFHLIYLTIVGIGLRPRFEISRCFFFSIFIISPCKVNPIDNQEIFSCITFNRRLMMVNLLRKVRLVRYIRPLKYFILSFLTSKTEITRLIVLISFFLAFFAPLIFIIESSSIHQSSIDIPITRSIRTISDACYYLILVITTVGFDRRKNFILKFFFDLGMVISILFHIFRIGFQC